jgi:hypothetical protein
MIRPLPIVLGVVAALMVGTGVSVALIRSGDDEAAPPATSTSSSTTVEVTTSTTAARAVTTTRPATTVPRVTTTRVTAPVTTRATVAATTTTKAPLTKAAATQGLCRDIEAAVRLVVDGSTIPGGLRLVRGINTYGDVADQSVVSPARRMASAGLNGDIDAAAVATEEAATACARLGFPIRIPPVECVTTPCP